MSQDRDRRLEGHSPDGIEEYDNPLPSWWVWLFWITIVFSVGYWGWYELGPGLSVHQAYEAEVRAAAERQAQQAARAEDVTDEGIAGLAKDRSAMTAAAQTYQARCLACHGPQGQGLIGPNLTDDYWLHGRRPTEIVRVIADGVPEKGMIPWKGQLAPAEIRAVAAYVVSLGGSSPPNPKPPQGVNSRGERAPEPTASR
jgi:cytochrome c oxidase cbb3-type subunit 3